MCFVLGLKGSARRAKRAYVGRTVMRGTSRTSRIMFGKVGRGDLVHEPCLRTYHNPDGEDKFRTRTASNSIFIIDPDLLVKNIFSIGLRQFNLELAKIKTAVDVTRIVQSYLRCILAVDDPQIFEPWGSYSGTSCAPARGRTRWTSNIRSRQ